VSVDERLAPLRGRERDVRVQSLRVDNSAVEAREPVPG
jgi:hypothetical protein